MACEGVAVGMATHCQFDGPPPLPSRARLLLSTFSSSSTRDPGCPAVYGRTTPSRQRPTLSLIGPNTSITSRIVPSSRSTPKRRHSTARSSSASRSACRTSGEPVASATLSSATAPNPFGASGRSLRRVDTASMGVGVAVAVAWAAMRPSRRWAHGWRCAAAIGAGGGQSCVCGVRGLTPAHQWRRSAAAARVEQPMRPKMHVLCGALVMKALLMLNNCSVVSHEVGGHRTAP